MKHRNRKSSLFLERIDILSYSAILLIWIINILIFAAIYALLSRYPGHGQITTYTLQTIHGFWSIVYYSVITATGTGYGDIVPLGYSRIFAGIESFSGLILLAVFVTKLLSRRQDIVLKEMHEISFQTALHNMREDLYVARKDLDMAISAVHTRDKLSEGEWAQLTVAFQQIGHLLEEIPDFYGTDTNLYKIDNRRENLLMEAVERTFGRILKLLLTLDERSISLDDGREIGIASGHMTKVAEKVIELWEKHGRAHHGEQLERIETTLQRIHAALHH